MARSQHRRQVCYETAREVYFHHEDRPYRAKRRAARRITGGKVRPWDLPTNAEVRRELVRLIEQYEPHLESTFDPLYQLQELCCDVEPAGTGELEAAELSTHERYQLYRMLLLPLEQVVRGGREHPEGDALYHSLQVFELAAEQMPYDEEFLLAALLHDVGLAIDRVDPAGAALEALEGAITERTAWLIEHLGEAHKIHGKTIGVRAHRRLVRNPSYEDLLALAECDRGGCVCGARTSSLDEALDTIRRLDDLDCGVQYEDDELRCEDDAA